MRGLSDRRVLHKSTYDRLLLYRSLPFWMKISLALDTCIPEMDRRKGAQIDKRIEVGYKVVSSESRKLSLDEKFTPTSSKDIGRRKDLLLGLSC